MKIVVQSATEANKLEVLNQDEPNVHDSLDFFHIDGFVYKPLLTSRAQSMPACEYFTLFLKSNTSIVIFQKKMIFLQRERFSISCGFYIVSYVFYDESTTHLIIINIGLNLRHKCR